MNARKPEPNSISTFASYFLAVPSFTAAALAPASDFEDIEDEIDAGTIAGIVIGCVIGMTLTVLGAFLLNKVMRNGNNRRASHVAPTDIEDEPRGRRTSLIPDAQQPLLRGPSSRPSSLRPVSGYGVFPDLEELRGPTSRPSTPRIRAQNMVGRHVLCPELPL